MKEETKNEKTDKKDDVKRGSLSLTDLILFGLGNVVGAGIFIIISKSIFTGATFHCTPS
jgi:amino acid permease